MNEGSSPKEGLLDGKTIPEISMKRTMTVSKRPWSLIVVFAVSLVFIIIFSLVHTFSKYITPSGTTDKLIAAFKKGDVETLLSDPELNFRERALSDIEKRGLEEYNKVDLAFEKCLEVGLLKYKALKSHVLTKGEDAYKSLPADEQRFIRSLSKTVWIYERGMEEIGKNDLLKESDPYVFIDDEKIEAYILKLGKKAVESGEADAIASPKSKKKKPVKEPSVKPPGQARNHEVGKELYEELKKRVYAAGSKAFSELPKEERGVLERKSKTEYIIEQGLKNLTPEDRALISSPSMFAEDADQKVESSKLCSPLISKSQRDLIEGKDYKDFVTKKNVYITKTGREKYEKFLQALFSGCEYEITRTNAYGKDAFDLIRVSRVSMEIEWKECSGVETFIPSVFLLELKDGKWRFVGEEEGVEAYKVEIEEPALPEEDAGQAEGEKK